MTKGMREMIRKSSVLAALAAVVAAAAAGPSQAITVDQIIRSVSLTFVDANGAFVAQDSDASFEVGNTGLTNPLNARIAGGGGAFDASIGVSAFGRYGIDATLFGAGTLSGTISFIERLTNDSSFAEDISLSFIVNEGFARLVGQQNTAVDYRIETGRFPIGNFDNRGALTGRQDFTTDFAETGDSLGANQPFQGGAVEIPFSVQTVDLGRLEPGESMNFFYDVAFSLGGSGILEVANFELTDPLLPPDQGQFSFSAVPVGPAVPVPPALLMAVTAFAAMGLIGRRRAQRARQQPVM